MGFPALFFFLALAAADPAAAGGPRVAADGRDSQLWEVAQGLEAHFMKEMIRNMRKTVQEGPEMANNRGYQLFRGMLDDQYAENAARGGQGIGLAEIIVKQILESQENVQRRRMPVRELNKSDVIRK